MVRLFFGLHRYLAGKYCKNLKVPRAQLNVNPARAMTWFVDVIIYCTFFNNSSPPPHQFLCNKILLKKISDRKGPGPPARIYTPTTGCFHDKTIISKENIRLDYYLLLKYCRRQCTLLTLTWAKPLRKFNPKMQGFKHVLDLNS